MGAESLQNIVTTTLNAWSKDVFNNVTNHNALLYFFKTFGKLGLTGKGGVKTGSIETRNGGKQIDEDVSIKENTNVGFVAYNEDVGTDVVDVLNTATFDWKYCYGNAVLWDSQIKMNADSQYRKHKLVENIILNTEQTMINAVGKGIWNTSDPDSLDGIPALITDTGLGTIGGISATTYPNWKNKVRPLDTTHTSAELLTAMAKLYRDCTRGVSMPDLIVTGPDLYSEFEAALTPNQRFTDAKMADAGFIYLKFHGATVIHDENCPDGRMYFLNTRALAFNFHSDAMFTVGDMEKKYGQQQYCWPITAMCNFSVRSRRDLGVLVVGDDGSSSS